MSEIVVLKLGGSIITKKREGKLEVDSKNLNRLSREIAQTLKEKKIKLVVVHGAGPFGHVLAKKYALSEGLKTNKQIEGMALTHQSMEYLNSQVVHALQKAGVVAISFQPSVAGVLKNKKLVSFQLDTLTRMLNLGLVPVAYGDVLLDLDTGINILSGDHLVPYLAREIPADRVVIATDVDGIYESDPKDGCKEKINRITKNNKGDFKLSGSKACDVTGGMQRKVEELLSLSDAGIKSQIISGLIPEETKKALLGKSDAGTFIK
ncbi:MAG: isopentenyl phosphate kinase [Methanobacteriota archaeon]